MTTQLKDVLRLTDVRMLDHFFVTEKETASIAEFSCDGIKKSGEKKM
jgi:DNA repair protein RadC